MTSRIVPIEKASSWVWESGHDNPRDAWSESTRESLWLRVYDLDGSPSESFLGHKFIGYHSFTMCGEGIVSRVFDAGLLGEGSVQLYSLVGDNFIPSLSHSGKQSGFVDLINSYLGEQAAYRRDQHTDLTDEC
tara:strand:- start:452 stop:850 length:399 start_codon:yes stop_codon:yes gene_type:complete